VAESIDLNYWLDTYLQIAVGALSPEPGLVFVQPGGEVAWDECDCDGQGWSRVLGVVPVMGQMLAKGLPCGIQYWDLQLAVGVLRCVASVDARGNPPGAVKITDDGHRFATDASDLLQAVTCAPHTRSVTGLTPLGPLGGCAGSEVAFTVRVRACACPDDEGETP
jgi:hypothetical protein